MCRARASVVVKICASTMLAPPAQAPAIADSTRMIGAARSVR
jgi:hypothetical protein